MLRDKAKIKGKVTARVFTFPAGEAKDLLALRDKYESARDKKSLKAFDKKWLKRRPVSLWRKLFLLAPALMVSVNHNIVTDEGDALIADLMAQTPAKTKVDNTNGYIQVGTGWTGTTPKTNTACNSGTGTPEVMDATYPKLKGAFGAANDNVVQYRSTFEAGDLNVSGIDEAIIYNNVTPASADCLAYAQITPEVNMTTADTLQVDWEITLLGA